MVNRFDCLRHDSVVSRDDKNRYIRYLRAARSHCGERGVAGRVEEGYFFTVQTDGVSADMLRDSARFGRRNVRASDTIEKRRFTMVDVSHNGNDGRSFNESCRVVCRVEGFGKNFFGCFVHFKFEFDSEIGGYNSCGIVINRVVYSLHDTFFKEFFRYLYRGNTEFFG